MSVEPVVATEEDVYSLQAKITQLASTIRQMKKDGLPVGPEVDKLNAMRKDLTELMKDNNAEEEFIKNFNRKSFDELLLRKFYVVPSFEIHNGPAGLFDYGPITTTLKNNILSLWRSHFINEGKLYFPS